MPMLEQIYTTLFQRLADLTELNGWAILDGSTGDTPPPYVSLAQCQVRMNPNEELAQRATVATVEILFVSKHEGGGPVREAMDAVIDSCHRVEVDLMLFRVTEASVSLAVQDGRVQRRGRVLVEVTGWEAF